MRIKIKETKSLLSLEINPESQNRFFFTNEKKKNNTPLRKSEKIF